MIDCCPMAAAIAPGAGSKDQHLFSYATNSSKQSKLNHKNIKEMEVQSGFRTYEAPLFKELGFKCNKGLCASPANVGNINGSGLYDLSKDNGVNEENSSWGW